MSALPHAAWPAADQAAWAASPTVRRWAERGGRFHKHVATAWGRLLTTATGRPICLATVTEHRDGLLAKHGRSRTALSYLERLAYALRVLRPRTDWSTFIELNRALRWELAGGRRERPLRGSAPSRSSRTVPPEARPAADLARWRAVMMPARSSGRADRYRRGGDAAPAPSAARSCASWSEAYRHRIARGYGLSLAWARRHGHPEGEVTPDAVAEYVEEHAQRGAADLSLVSYTYELWRALMIVRPDEDWSWLREDVQALEAKAVPKRDKRASCVPLQDVLRLGQDLMREAARGPATRTNATLYRDGLMIALACWRPKRVSNLASMRFGREVVLAVDGTPLRLQWARTKNGDASDVTWPVALLPAWHAWLTRWRPVFIGTATGDTVWPAKDGGALSIDGIGQAFARRTRTAFGIALRPHMWRTLYATSLLTEDPALAPAVSTMLDHRDHRSLEPYALDARTRGAATTLDRSLAQLAGNEANGGRGSTGPHRFR